MAQSLVSYRNILQDNARWQQLALRDGDIVISTPPKAGTTWTQMICALLIFQTPELPRPLDALSVWPDALTHRLADLLANVDCQRHRRFFKTHTPFDGLPFDERVTYLCVGRDPRDCALSWDSHAGNLDFDVIMAMRAEERFWQWVDQEKDVVVGLEANLHHLSTFWRRRHLPKVLLQYDDLRVDLAGQMRRLAARLGIGRAGGTLAGAGARRDLRARERAPEEFAPERSIWRDPARFFHRGTSRQWEGMLDAEGLRRYARRVAGLGEAELVDCVHRGPGLA